MPLGILRCRTFVTRVMTVPLQVQQGLKLRTVSQIVGRPAAGFLVAQHAQRPTDALASETSTAPMFKSSRLVGGTTTTGEQKMQLCTSPGLRPGLVHIGVMTRCVQYTPYFRFARDSTNIKVSIVCAVSGVSQ